MKQILKIYLVLALSFTYMAFDVFILGFVLLKALAVEGS